MLLGVQLFGHSCRIDQGMIRMCVYRMMLTSHTCVKSRLFFHAAERALPQPESAGFSTFQSVGRQAARTQVGKYFTPASQNLEAEARKKTGERMKGRTDRRTRESNSLNKHWLLHTLPGRCVRCGCSGRRNSAAVSAAVERGGKTSETHASNFITGAVSGLHFQHRPRARLVGPAANSAQRNSAPKPLRSSAAGAVSDERQNFEEAHRFGQP